MKFTLPNKHRRNLTLGNLYTQANSSLMSDENINNKPAVSLKANKIPISHQSVWGKLFYIEYFYSFHKK